MEYAENEDLVRIDRTSLVDNDIRQTAHHPLIRAGNATGMSDAWEFTNRSAASRMRAATCVAATGCDP